MKIGVFDSGVGGLSVANAIQKALPAHQIILKQDETHLPYGNRTPGELLYFVMPILLELVSDGAQVLVIACNTVSTTLITQLREQFEVPIIGVEPLVKVASELTKNSIIAVCATPTTLRSNRYKSLKQIYAENIKVIEPDCSDWALLIEQQAIEQRHIARSLESALAAGADVVVLGCTHYHWIESEIAKAAAGRAVIIQPEKFVIEELNQVLSRL